MEIKERVKIIPKIIGTIKSYIARTNSYLAMVNSCLLLYIAISTKVNIALTKVMPVIIICIIIFQIGIGYIDQKYIFANEMVRNPVNKAILNRLERIEEKLQ